MGDHPLDNALWSSLTGPHARLAERKGRAARYHPDLAAFAAIPDDPAASDWADLAALAGPRAQLILPGPSRTPPTGWDLVEGIPGIQLDGSGMAVVADPEAVILGAADGPEMLDLVERTRPGPFQPRTHLLGTYLGIRHGGALVAMAGERMRPPGWSEISAVCTDPAFQGHGLAGRLMRAVGAVIRERGDVPFLHMSASNHTARRLYEHLGFVLRGHLHFVVVRTPHE